MSDNKKEFVKQYIRSLGSIEDAMEPYKEQKRALRQEFKDNGWLDTDEIRAAVKAYRLFKGNIDIDKVLESYNTITGNGGEE
jgi:allophanate hydrolase subunit 2